MIREYPVKPGDRASMDRSAHYVWDRLDGDPYDIASLAGDSHWTGFNPTVFVIATTKHMFGHPMNAFAFVLLMNENNSIMMGWLRLLDLKAVK